DGELLAPTFGTTGEGWVWQNAGTVDVKQPGVSIELRDLTGFDGRCDALYFTTDQDSVPPAEPDDTMSKWRRELLGLPEKPPVAGEFDLVVLGGGVSGCAAALTASRLGLDVALIQDRPVLGGNASREIGIPPRGLGGPIVNEVVAANRMEVLKAEENLKLYVAWHAFRVQKQNRRIISIDAKNTLTNREVRFRAPLFVDCTGDGWIGYWAGAEFRMGREARAEFDESLAPEQADRMTHGNTIKFLFRTREHPVSFPEVPWATEVSRDFADLGGWDHFWECGQWLDKTVQGEYVRDHLLRAIYGTFSTVKRQDLQKHANLELTWVSHVAARGESRRLMGDHILTENDIRNQTPFPDWAAMGSQFFCLHYPDEKYDFRSSPETWQLIPVDPYPIPLRCLYSRNIDNLMMAGRCISATHVAFSSIKIMKTGGQTGRATGIAAMLCKTQGTTPRGVARSHMAAFHDLLAGRGQYRDALSPRSGD
ncbi:MAG: FAD-dependent oxidoreductase, partial [Planctomycetota bacterium]